jgi:hypothetical protein
MHSFMSIIDRCCIPLFLLRYLMGKFCVELFPLYCLVEHSTEFYHKTYIPSAEYKDTTDFCLE